MKSIKPNYIIIPGTTVVIAALGRIFTSTGLSWYQNLTLPIFVPSSLFITIMWQIIFVLTTISVLLVWNTFEPTAKFWAIISCFSVNAILNITWSYLFFYKHMIGFAAIDAGMLTLTVFILVVLLWPLSRISSLLLFPYLIWSSFATFLNVLIWLMN